jgi:hypothetical protein
MADYDLNAIADALAATFQQLAMFRVDSTDVPLNAYAEPVGVPTMPAIVMELDDLDWDIVMARGGDEFVFVATVLFSDADNVWGQRALRSALSTGGLANRMKDALEANQELGGQVSYAVMTGARRVGRFTYAGAEYIGAELVIEVTAQ